jgi:DNA transformation protein
MARPSEFVSHLLELLAPLGDVSARAMFGGWGIYEGGRMFGLVAYETFYVKADDGNRADFTTCGLAPFHYETKNGRREVMSYYTVPADALDSSSMLCAWAQKGIEAAQRAARKPPKKRRTPK